MLGTHDAALHSIVDVVLISYLQDWEAGAGEPP